METVSLLVVDDHQVVRQGLCRMLEIEEDIRVIGEAANIDETLTVMESHPPDIVLMDVQMPGMNGIEATKLLKSRFPSCHVIVLTFNEDFLIPAIEAGASGYFIKGIKQDELVTAIRTINLWRMILFRNGLSHFSLVRL